VSQQKTVSPLLSLIAGTHAPFHAGSGVLLPMHVSSSPVGQFVESSKVVHDSGAEYVDPPGTHVFVELSHMRPSLQYVLQPLSLHFPPASPGWGPHPDVNVTTRDRRRPPSRILPHHLSRLDDAL
jgi:hypothetical protein